jgi:putative ribosome biogenesis GTPase RsgA
MVAAPFIPSHPYTTLNNCFVLMQVVLIGDSGVGKS